MMSIISVSENVSLKRNIEQGTADQQEAVSSILARVKNEGDAALFSLTEQLDRVALDTMRVTQDEINAAYDALDDEVIEAIKEARTNIYAFHEKQARQSWFTTDEEGTMLGQKITPLDAVGVYVPGGTAAYPSSVMMNILPAKVAGVKRIVMVTPPQKDGQLPPGVLVAANEVGVEEMYKVGGAQAIASLAFGTETIAPVDKIVGPGNIYVALAKRAVFGTVDIDMIAGPSEIVVLADDSAEPSHVAADLLSQAEHDPMASAVLVTPSQQMAEKTVKEINAQLETLPRKEIAEASIRDFGAAYVASDLSEAIEVVNELAPEHLEVVTKDPMSLLGQVRHAGAIFLGPNSSEPVGDYFAGPNHVLPTNGTAKFSSPLNVDDFQKKSSVIYYSDAAMAQHGKKIAAIARLEGLEAHARAVEKRLGEE